MLSFASIVTGAAGNSVTDPLPRPIDPAKTASFDPLMDSKRASALSFQSWGIVQKFMMELLAAI